MNKEIYEHARKLVADNKIKEGIKLLLEQELEEETRIELLLYHNQVVRWERRSRMGLLGEDENYLRERPHFAVLEVINILEEEAKDGVQKRIPLRQLEFRQAKAWAEMQRLQEALGERAFLHFLYQQEDKQLLRALLTVAQKEKQLAEEKESSEISAASLETKTEKLRQEKTRLLAVVSNLEKEVTGLSTMVDQLQEDQIELKKELRGLKHILACIELLSKHLIGLKKSYRRWQWLAGVGIGTVVLRDYFASTDYLNSSTYGPGYDELGYDKNGYNYYELDRQGNSRDHTRKANTSDVIDDPSISEIDPLDVDVDL